MSADWEVEARVRELACCVRKEKKEYRGGKGRMVKQEITIILRQKDGGEKKVGGYIVEIEENIKT